MSIHNTPGVSPSIAPGISSHSRGLAGSTSTPYVRPARLSDARDIAALQAAHMAQMLTHELGAELSQPTRSQLNAGDFASQWASAIGMSKDREALHTVLVLHTTEQLLGFSALAPAHLPAQSANTGSFATPESSPDSESSALSGAFLITALEWVGSDTPAESSSLASTRASAASSSPINNGSTLLAATLSAAQRSGARTVYLWLFPSSPAVPIVSQAGFSPVGEQQIFEVDGVRLVQHLWAHSYE
ncbi:MAG: hypothetical protein MR006_08015 [Arcanobacterium sp.]|nr:hypothetical protein [Arcanobacterium sp.]MDY5589034.1 hypothetical protein [Arcanobacterium sp.]